MFLDSLLAKIAPHECLGCGAEGQLLCPVCAGMLRAIPSRCFRCQRITEDYRVCPACRKHSVLYSVQPFTQYEGLAKALVWKLKFSGAQAAAAEMARMIKIGTLESSTTLVPVPTATSRVRGRGYDQAVLLSRTIARDTGVSLVACLRRSGQNEQVGAGREQRLKQLQGVYRCTDLAGVHGKHVVLVDDVLTTGATLEAAGRVLKLAGAARISALVFAQV